MRKTLLLFAFLIAALSVSAQQGNQSIPSGTTVSGIDNFLYVDGIKYPTVSSALAALPAAGGTIFDCFPETWNADPFAAVTKSFRLILCANISATQWVTNVPLRLNHSGQTIEGGGVNASQIAAGPSFPINSYIFSIGQPFPGIYGTMLRDLAISCGLAPVVGCGAVNFDGVQELSGAIRIQGVNCTTTTGCLRFSSDQGAGATQDALTFSGLGAIMFTGTNQSCTGPVIEVAASSGQKINIKDVTVVGVMGGCTGVLNPAGIQMDSTFEANLEAIHGEQVTSVVLSTTTANIQLTQITGHSSDVNVFTSTAAGGNWTANDLFAFSSTGNTLNDTGNNVIVAAPGNVTFCTRSGSATPSVFCPNSNAGWVSTLPLSTTGFNLKLQAGFTGSNSAILLQDNVPATVVDVKDDGRFLWHGNSATAGVLNIFQHSNTSNRTTTFPDVSGTVFENGATIPAGDTSTILNCALAVATACLTTGETTAATTAGAVEDQVTTLTTSTAIPLQITMGANGPAAANAPAVLNVSAAAAGGLASASINGLVGAPITLLTGAGSAGGATTGNGGTGGAFSVTTGTGGAAGGTTTNTGGIGGAINLTTGAGSQGAATGAGQAGGAQNFLSGNGGAGGVTSGTGGAGGAVNLTAGTGGSVTGASTGGAGGNIVLTPGGAGGTGATTGQAGRVAIAGPTMGGSQTQSTLSVTGTWNTTGVPVGALLVNMTNTASALGGSLFSTQLGGANFLNVLTQSATPATAVANGPNLALQGSQPTITTPGTTPYLNLNTLQKQTKNTCTFALTTGTFTLALSPVSLCTYTLPNLAVTWYWACTAGWSNPAGTTPTFAIGVNWAQAPSVAFQMADIYTTNAGVGTEGATSTTTNANILATGVLTPAATIFQTQFSGTFTGSATSGTFTPTASLTGTGATGTLVGGCTIQ